MDELKLRAKYLVEAVDDEDFEPFVGMYEGPTMVGWTADPEPMRVSSYGFQTQDGESDHDDHL